ncbi:DNA processing protein DprA [Spirochaetia bacterium]|nr:DNA processing protein DprA [Spirochaetia bacterium]
MAEHELLDLIIARIPLKMQERIRLYKECDRIDDLVSGTQNDLEALVGRTFPETFEWNPAKWRSQAEQDLTTIRKRAIHVVSLRDTTYPPLLREMHDPPVLLFYRGTLPDPEHALVAMVGTRHPSPAGSHIALTMGQEFASAHISVVSGLALGIDALAHRGNLSGQTVAVLGSGLDEMSPVSNRPLAHRILENSGCILSEYPPGTTPSRWRFPQRNRIITGISRGTVIVEAPQKSGALISARCAAEQNRDVFVASKNGKALGVGAQKLVDDGAKVIESAGDVLEDWGISG